MTGNSNARKRAGGERKDRSPLSPSRKEKEAVQPDIGGDSDTSEEESLNETRSEKQRETTRSKRAGKRSQSSSSNTLVTIAAIVLVATLVGVTIVLRPAKKAAKDDVPPLEDQYAGMQDSGKAQGGEEATGRSTMSERTVASKQPPSSSSSDDDGDAPDYDYDNPEDDEEEDTDPAMQGGRRDSDAENNRRASGASEDGGVDDMMPTDPMEDEPYTNGPNNYQEGGDMEQNPKKPGDQPDSLMRPHEPVKPNIWRVIAEKTTQQKAEQLHSHVRRLENVISMSEGMQMIKHHEELVAEHAMPPPWCFHDEDWMNQVLGEEQLQSEPESFTIDSPSTGRVYCVKSQEVHDRLSAKLPYSTATLVARGENEVLDNLELRLDEQLGLPKDHAYHSQLIKYRAGEKYYPHVDCDQTRVPTASSNDRYATIIIYLTDVKKGGDTTFTRLGISVKPKRGSAVIFRNLHPNGSCDLSMTHRGDAPLSGVKYIYQHWYHESVILPSYTENIVLCDSSSSCREYIHSKKTREATDIVRQGERARPNLKKSLEFYKQALKIQPGHAQGLLYAGDSYAQLKQSREALRFFEKHLKLHPKSIDGNFVAAGLWQDLGKRAKAIELLQRVVAVSPRDADALFNIASLYADEGHIKKSVASLKALVLVDPKDHGAHSLLAELLDELGQKDAAKKHRAIADKLKTRSRQ